MDHTGTHRAPRESNGRTRRRLRNWRRAERLRGLDSRVLCVECNVVLNSYSLRMGSSVCSPCLSREKSSPSKYNSFRTAPTPSPEKRVRRERRGYLSSPHRANNRKSNRNGYRAERDDRKPNHTQNSALASNKPRNGRRYDVHVATLPERAYHEARSILEHGMQQCTSTYLQGQSVDVALPFQPRLLDTPHPPPTTYSPFSSVSFVHRPLFDNPASFAPGEPVAGDKNLSTDENDNSFSLPISSSLVKRDANAHHPTPVNHRDCFYFSNPSASFRTRTTAKEYVGNVNSNAHTHKECTEDSADPDDRASRGTIKFEDTRVNVDTVDENPNVREDNHSTQMMPSSPGETNRGTNATEIDYILVESEDDKADGNCLPPAPHAAESETRATSEDEDNGGGPSVNSPCSSESDVVVKKERLRTSEYSPTFSTAVNTITDSLSLKREPRCKTCKSRIVFGVRHASSSLCQSCFFIEQLRSVDELSPASTPAKDTVDNHGPLIDEQPPSNGGESDGLFRVDSLSSLDLPPPDYDETASNISSPGGPIDVDEIDASSNQIATPSPRTIRLCRVCDNGTAGVVSGHIKLWVCGACRYESVPRKPSIWNVGRTVVKDRLLDDEHLSKFARRRQLSAPLHDDEVFIQFVRRKKRRKHC